MKLTYDIEDVVLKYPTNCYGYGATGKCLKVHATINQVGNDFICDYITTGSNGVLLNFQFNKESKKADFLLLSNQNIHLSTRKKFITTSPNDIIKALEEEFKKWCDNYTMKWYDIYMSEYEAGGYDI